MKRLKHLDFKRKRLGLTNYKKRLTLLKSRLPRLVVRRSNKYLTAQIVLFNAKGDNVLLTVTSKALDKYGWSLSKKNLPAAYLTGLIIGRKALSKGVKKAILDIGRFVSTKGNRFYALVLGAKHAGLEIPCSMQVDEGRVKGLHISEFYGKVLQGTVNVSTSQFSKYKENNLKPDQIQALFENVKQKILNEAK